MGFPWVSPQILHGGHRKTLNHLGGLALCTTKGVAYLLIIKAAKMVASTPLTSGFVSHRIAMVGEDTPV